VPELRKDPVTGLWVIVGTERPCVPADLRAEPPAADVGPCPFCAGHEHETPPEVLAYRPGSDAGENGPGWRVRVVPNKFPALRIEGDIERRGHGLYDLMNGVGAHELVIESPRHDDDLTRLSLAAVEDVVHAFQERMNDLRRDARFRAIVAFKPTLGGPGRGHPHSEVLATPTVPPDLQRELGHARSYFEYRERCLFCDILSQELDEGTRIVVESDHVVALAPFASPAPFAVWLLPRRHLPGYESVHLAERRDLARVLRTVLQRLRALLARTPIAFVLHSAPFGVGDVGHFHWHVEVLPRTTAAGRSADGSGFPVNPLPPEDAAQMLRGGYASS
jgi:UDPglucose--hexose-1-phosphate uridylyltransferase